MAVIAKNCVKNFTDYRTVLASRVGLDYDNVIELSNKHPLLQQTEWSDVPDDTEWDVPGLSPPEVGPQAISLPLNEAEIYRIKRALLRYELFCAIFYLGPDGYFDNIRRPRHFNTAPESCRRRAFRKDQVIFLKEYVNPWEIGELAVVSQFMFDLVRCVYFDAKDVGILASSRSPKEFLSLAALSQPMKSLNCRTQVCHADSEDL